jgi:hypothetical protein
VAWPNVIPDAAEASLLYRTVAETGPLRQAVLATAEPGVEITFPLEIPSVTAESLPGWECTTVNFASDLPFLAAWGTGYQFGPGTIRVAHTDDEQSEGGSTAWARAPRTNSSPGDGRLMTTRVPVAVLGATGTIQKFVGCW